jgi:hypothetical protein
MNTTLLNPVADFAAAVRAALSDLPADEVDELTDGLEGDLAERLADGGGPSTSSGSDSGSGSGTGSGSASDSLGDPVAYATELRLAAGLPPRSSVPSNLTDNAAKMWSEFRSGAADLPGARALAAFFVALRPVWWVMRAWIAYVVLASFVTHSNDTLPSTPLRAFAFVALAVVSVQLGRGKWLSNRWVRRVFIAGNVIAVLAIPFVVGLAANQVSNYRYGLEAVEDYSVSGMTLNGTQISNIFAYDAQGNPLTDVQLFDQDGNPLAPATDAEDYLWSYTSTGLESMLVPSADVVGRPGWNVFPLETLSEAGFDLDGNPLPEGERSPATPPFLIVSPLAGQPSPSPIPSLTPTPSPSP